VSWAAILALAAGTYAMKAAGPVLLGGRPLPPPLERVVVLLPAALLAALIAVQTFVAEGELTIDARAAGGAAAAAAAWRDAPFLVVVGVAMVVAAAVRAVAGA
jgi:branched-subunit amino acid transport protein